MWHAKAKGGYSRDTQEALDNARMMATVMTAQGWSLQSIAAMLGNGAGESGLNPWRWESDDVPTYSEYQSWSSSEARSHGYGLFGFTPASKYIEGGRSYEGYAPNFSDRAGNASDGAAQTSYFSATVGSSWGQGNYDYYFDDFAEIGVDINDFYYMSFDEFKSGNDSIANLTGAFCLCYERPADWAAASSYSTRVSNANHWYETLSSLSYEVIDSLPEPGNPFYNTTRVGGVSTCVEPPNQIAAYRLNVLPNCVGLANGAFNETYYLNSDGATIRQRYPFVNDPPQIYEVAKNTVDGNLTLPPSEDSYPPLGGLICWDYGSDGSAHVAYISEVIDKDHIVTQDSGYGDANYYWVRTERTRNDKNWGDSRRWIGFIYNPAIGTGPKPIMKVPRITAVQSITSTRITVTGTANADNDSEVRLYIKWDSGNVSQSDYDTIVTTRGDFSVNVTKPKRAASVAILPVRTEDGTEGSIYIATGLIVAIPCINIYVNGSMKQSIPYVRTGNRWRETLPVLRTDNEWKEIWNVKE